MNESKAKQEIIEIAEARFGGGEAKSLKIVLEDVNDPEKLRALFRLALRCSKFDELIQSASV